MDFSKTKSIVICAHSYEGATLCFLTACREGAALLGPHMHPTLVMSAVPLGLSMAAYEKDNYQGVAPFLKEGVEMVAKSGADFFICPDNTAHIIFEDMIDQLPIPGLHIADVVCNEIVSHRWKKVGLLGTRWTMTGPVYKNALEKNKLTRLIPDDQTRTEINDAIFDELCKGIFKKDTIAMFVNAIEVLKEQGAECVILGCTEIPLIINAENSPVPPIDSTRMLAKYAVAFATCVNPLPKKGWIRFE